MVPAVLHQRPQIVCERWVCWSGWALAVHYGQHGRCGYAMMEGDRTGENLGRSEMVIR